MNPTQRGSTATNVGYHSSSSHDPSSLTTADTCSKASCPQPIAVPSSPQASTFCATHKCRSPSCPSSQSASSPLCIAHTCLHPTCSNPRATIPSNAQFCTSHACRSPSCLEHAAPGTGGFCASHCCGVDGCSNPRSQLDYCEGHFAAAFRQMARIRETGVATERERGREREREREESSRGRGRRPLNEVDEALTARSREERERLLCAEREMTRGRGFRDGIRVRDSSLDSGIGGSPTVLSYDDGMTYVS